MRRDLEHYVQQRWGVALAPTGGAEPDASATDGAGASGGSGGSSVEALMTQSPLETLAALMQVCVDVCVCVCVKGRQKRGKVHAYLHSLALWLFFPLLYTYAPRMPAADEGGFHEGCKLLL